MGIESEAAEEMVSAVGSGVERAIPLVEQLAKEVISEAFKDANQKPSVRQALNDIKRSRQQKALTQPLAAQKTIKPKVRGTR